MTDHQSPHPMSRVQSEHTRRKAIIYVRQSSPGQVERHQESTALQYGLVDRAQLLGWPAAHIEVIDEDLGLSGRSSAARCGYLRLVAETARCRVGIILSYDVSRLSRNLADWGGLLELCSQSNTLIADVETVYDLERTNDRFLLGIKGTMSEAEIHVMRQRMHAGREAKAARGELVMKLPRGYVRNTQDEVIFDPDQGVQASVRGVFEIFAQCGSVAATLRQLAREGEKLPQRVDHGIHRGQLVWRRPNRATLHNMLTNPTYAGAYAWGRKRSKGSSQLPVEERWRHLIRDQHPAYISWSEFLDNQRKISANQWPVRSCSGALLAGLLKCGVCGWKMRVTYSSDGDSAQQYVCLGEQLDYGGERCQSFGAVTIDRQVSELLLSTLSPAALEISLQAVSEVEADRARQHQQWQNKRQRAQQEADRAQLEHSCVDPKNRLVAQTLEDQWEAALAAQARLEHEYQIFCEQLPVELTASERARLQQAGAGVDRLWRDNILTNPEKSEIARLLMTEVRVTIIDDSEVMKLEIQWQGGHQTTTQAYRPVVRYQQLRDYDALYARATDLKEQGEKLADIAETLNQEGWRPARKDRFTTQTVQKLLRTQTPDGGAGIRRRIRPGPVDRKPHEWLLSELSERLDIPKPTLYNWIASGKLDARKEAPPADGKPRRWLVCIDETEMKTLRRWRKSENWKKPIREREQFPELTQKTKSNTSKVD